MSDDQKHKSIFAKARDGSLNIDHMKTLMEGISEHAKQMSEPEHGQQKILVHPSVLATLESAFNAGGMAKSHTHNWQLAGVQVVVSEHAPPDKIMIINDDPLRAVLPTLTLDPKKGFNEHAPRWEPDFEPLLYATQCTIMNTNRGHFSTIICADDSPILPERPRQCWVCKDVFMSRKPERWCAACRCKFWRDQEQFKHDLKMIAHAHFHLEMRRLGKPCPTHNWPNPPYLTAKQTREKLAAAKKKRRRQKIKARRKLKTKKEC